jgi:hypothetical protein
LAATTARSSADGGGAPAGFDGSSDNAYAFATLAPDATYAAAQVAAHPKVTLGGTADLVLGAASQGAFYEAGTTGTETFTSSIGWTVGGTPLSGHLVLGLLDNQVLGAGFDTLDFVAVVGTTTLDPQHFTNPGDAQTFFNDTLLDLARCRRSRPSMSRCNSPSRRAAPGPASAKTSCSASPAICAAPASSPIAANGRSRRCGSAIGSRRGRARYGRSAGSGGAATTRR